MPRAKQERAEVTRAAIVEGAARAFDAAGFGSTSLSDIVKEAGVTKGALYFHFASKESLAYAVMEDQFDTAALLERVERPGVQTAIDLTHRMARELRSNVRVRAGIRLVLEYGSFSDPDRRFYDRWIATLRACLEPARDSGDLRPEVSAEDAATLVVGSFTGIQIASQVRTGREDLTRRVTDLWTWLLPGLVPPRRLGRFDPAGSADLDTVFGLPDAAGTVPAVAAGSRSPAADRTGEPATAGR
ncbi:ScbR family autoregulator-binding transcription factor [Streptomyces sp. JJ36]|uniref:ScbR family autoregulator-binding transcription factor n=1 Tax=Streptomyces sp. JJ36 TaxID=2736645 RepID=UPI001F34AEB7|nr:ScbR family autoregulator-binding transcription factor [Streptomyces sp. JJ36]MCF6524516.1 TetR/AcrR family transcriptional regulator [Streptomyces sp. JJ36]